MSVARFDRTLTDGEVKALTGPMFGLGADDDFDVTVIVEARHDGVVHESVVSTTGDTSMITRQALPSLPPPDCDQPGCLRGYSCEQCRPD